ncbi:Spore coat protein SP96 [Fusarium oxysporum f. sp. albedinis]|nr:Spore coat protein SP96 [Fusarium oxysporum f. sp. albedinis]
MDTPHYSHTFLLCQFSALHFLGVFSLELSVVFYAQPAHILIDSQARLVLSLQEDNNCFGFLALRMSLAADKTEFLTPDVLAQVFVGSLFTFSDK